MMTIVYIILQMTWGCLQSCLGLMMFLIHIRDPHCFVKGAVVTKIKGQYSVSLGMFLFVHDEALIPHEYGHSIQSLLLGPLYLLLIGLPSFLWCHLPICRRYQSRGHDYYDFPIEKQANQFGNHIVPLISNEKKKDI